MCVTNIVFYVTMIQKN